MKNRFLGLLLMFLAIFVWGISFVSTKIVLTELPPVSIAFFRQFVAIVPTCIHADQTESFKPDKAI